MAVARVAFTGAAVAENDNGFVMRGHEIHVASLGFVRGLDAPNSLPNAPSLTVSNSQWGTKVRSICEILTWT